MKALLIVDMQNDFMPGGALPVPYADEIIPVINELQKKFDLIFASMDWHPENHCSFNKFPPHCVQGTKGARIVPNLTFKNIEYLFEKGTQPQVDNYSIFKYNSGETISYQYLSTAAEFLKSYDVTDLYICGVAAEICVRINALDAKDAGFNTFIVYDAVKWLNIGSDFIEWAKDELHQQGIQHALSRYIDNDDR